MGKNRGYCRFQGTVYNFSKVYDILEGKSDGDIMETLVHEYDIEPLDAMLFEEVIDFNNGELPADYDEVLEQYRAANRASWESKQVHCKYCGSTNVKKLGFIDSMAYLDAGLQWHCNNCGSNF